MDGPMTECQTGSPGLDHPVSIIRSKLDGLERNKWTVGTSACLNENIKPF